MTIMLEMANATDAHAMWERRLDALCQMYERQPCFVDRDGKWGLRDFLDYARIGLGYNPAALAAQHRQQAVVEREANIVLISQTMSMSGFETHGLFSTFASALDHVCKDEGLTQGAWSKVTDTSVELVYRNTRWVASREPARAALARSQDNEGGGPHDVSSKQEDRL